MLRMNFATWQDGKQVPIHGLSWDGDDSHVSWDGVDSVTTTSKSPP
jgi:hypothetical protein